MSPGPKDHDELLDLEDEIRDLLRVEVDQVADPEGPGMSTRAAPVPPP